MKIDYYEMEQTLAGIVASIGKNPESWKDWMCLQISFKNKCETDIFGRSTILIQNFIDAYFKGIEIKVFSCQNQSIHVFCKHVACDVLVYAGQLLCDLLFDEEALLTSYDTFDLEKDAFYYVSYALDQAAGTNAIPVSAYSGLDPFVAKTTAHSSACFNEKIIVNQQDLAKVLLVEDDPVTRWMVRRCLKHNCQLVTAPTANQSFDRFKNFQPDVVFLDIDLPDKNGREVLNWMLKNDPGACVVMFSTNNDLENISGSLKDGASGFISKPFLREDLLHYIEAHSN